MFGSSLAPGDWVRTKRQVRQTLYDHASGGGIPAGTLGVVKESSGSRVVVELDAGWGTTHVTVGSHEVRVVRRRGGTDRFHRWSRRVTIVRLGCAVALMLPVAMFVVQYVWAYHSFDGIVPAFALACLDAVGLFIAAGIAHPLQTIVFCCVCAVVSRIAWGRRRN